MEHEKFRWQFRLYRVSFNVTISSNGSLVPVAKKGNLRKTAAGNSRKIRKGNEPFETSTRSFTD